MRHLILIFGLFLVILFSANGFGSDGTPVLRLLPDGALYGSLKVCHLEDINLDEKRLDPFPGTHWVVPDYKLGIPLEKELCQRNHYYASPDGDIYVLLNRRPSYCTNPLLPSEEFLDLFRQDSS